MSIISFSHVTFSYPTTDVLTNVSFTCGTDERLCVVGPNGSGKTTLLKLALGELTPLHGHVDTPLSWDNHAPPTTVGDVIDAACHQVLKLRHEFDMLSHKLAFDVSAETARRFDELLARMTAMNGWELDTQLDKTLRSLGLGNIARDRPLNSLSPGQQERLHLAAVLLRGSPALVVDEPTNHLDIESKEIVEAAIMEFKGTVLIVSHDRYLLSKIPDRILELRHDGIREYKGKFDYYLEKSAEFDKKDVEIGEDENTNELSAEEERRIRKEREAEERRRSRRISELEAIIHDIEAKIEEIESEMCKPEHASDVFYLREAGDKADEYKTELESIYDEWLSLQED